MFKCIGKKTFEVKIHLIIFKHIFNEYLNLDKIKNKLKQYIDI